MSVIRNENASDAFSFIVPIVRIFEDTIEVLGTGFFITSTGVIVTARHVIEANILAPDKDRHEIGILHFLEEHFMYRRLVYSAFNSPYDVAVCETQRYETPEGMGLVNKVAELSLAKLVVGDSISTQGYHDHSTLRPGRSAVMHTIEHEGEWVTDDLSREIKYRFAASVSVGQVLETFPNGRDRTMLPFPSFSSNLSLQGGTSGAPVFDQFGRVVGINCSELESEKISYHCMIEGLLGCKLPNIVLGDENTPSTRSIQDLVNFGAIAVSSRK